MVFRSVIRLTVRSRAGTLLPKVRLRVNARALDAMLALPRREIVHHNVPTEPYSEAKAEPVGQTALAEAVRSTYCRERYKSEKQLKIHKIHRVNGLSRLTKDDLFQ